MLTTGFHLPERTSAYYYADQNAAAHRPQEVRRRKARAA
jgi:hypothetical protein